jgi:hypothetical protein
MKAAPIARYGACEVRLVEFSETFPTNTFVFWLELFDHKDNVAVDGGGANDLEEAVTLAEELASQAEELCKKTIEIITTSPWFSPCCNILWNRICSTHRARHVQPDRATASLS